MRPWVRLATGVLRSTGFDGLLRSDDADFFLHTVSYDLYGIKYGVIGL